ncbi:peptidyl-prolyl cis-trans isomerase ppi1 [Cyclospora cayetanensis]|uniref:Peptidyl-prolyl cis-trans isomerase n=2 Tax=Cyclospora cayetanensis TaxID=88456 RepID=A0A1D3D2X4_9EIME|nr:peptidyl-prolyl cis-trans isomerase ppi1 [Cyclospora cayetanensis]OEH77792.1 peptidyl-prolyl cis-trans isomerase family 1 [Cyclospora cayetanensis]
MFALAETRRTRGTAHAEDSDGQQGSLGALVSQGPSSSSSISSLLDSLDASDSAAVEAAVEAVRASGALLSSRRVCLHTTIGDIHLELYWCHAPRACINFFLLAKTGCYDGTVFHRVCQGRWAQGGDPTGTGRGGVSIFGKSFVDEIHPELRHTGAGVLTMANHGPNTNTSQFILLLGPAPTLDGKSTIFGRVCGGIHTLKKLSLVQTTKTDRPLHDVKIIRASVAESAD